MNVDRLLADLACRGVALFLVGDRLRYQASPEALTPELRDTIAQHRPAIIELLRQDDHDRKPPRTAKCVTCVMNDWIDLPPRDGRIRTVCGRCGHFVGYRPVKCPE